MSIKSIKVLNVMAFQRQICKNNADCNTFDVKTGDTLSDSFHLDFCDGINILLGENGVGKTTLLKMIYAATQWSIPHTDAGKTKRLADFFSSNLSDADLLKNYGRKEDYSYYEVSDGEHSFKNSLSHKVNFNYDQWLGLNIQSVYIPTMEMLSHSKGFLALDKKYKLPFDGTQVDIIVNASLPEARELPEFMERILEKISKAIDGTVVVEDDTFYVIKTDRRKVDFSLEAGIQIFVATHSYNLAKYFEIRRKREEQVLYHNLYRAPADVALEYAPLKTPENGDELEIYSRSAKYLSMLKGNKIVAADDNLLEEAIEKRMFD